MISEIAGVPRHRRGGVPWLVRRLPADPTQLLDLPEDFVLAKIIRAAQLAQDTGAKIVWASAP